MMTEITIYHAASGVILRTMTISGGNQAALTRLLALNVGDGEAWVEGRWPAETHRIRDGVPEQLPDPSTAAPASRWPDRGPAPAPRGPITRSGSPRTRR